MERMRWLIVVSVMSSLFGCSHQQRVENVNPEEAARISRRLVRNAVVYGPGADTGAVVPDVSAPCLSAELIPEHMEDGGRKLVERHREWHLNCDIQLLGIPAQGGK